jgi:hypothetical protein
MTQTNDIYTNAKYRVRTTTNALGEDGAYGQEGYAVINIETGIVEHTTIVLPQALFQADAFMGALGQLDAAEEPTELPTDLPIDPDLIN